MEKENFARIVWEARDTMYRVAKSILIRDADCEDAVSQGIVTAFSKLSSLKKEEYAKTWLIRIVINECYHICRVRKREVSLEERRERLGEKEGEAVVFPGDEYSELYLALGKLPSDTRIALVLYYLDGYTIREISRIQRTTEGTVKSRLSRGRRKLKELLTETEGGNFYEAD